MPKLIEHLREDILRVSKQTLLSDGYPALTMRGVAAECGIAAGTLYNYFENKDMLVANVILEDWLSALRDMRESCLSAEDPVAGIRGIYRCIVRFQQPYLQIWEQYQFSGKNRGVYRERHMQLVEQLRVLLHELFSRFGISESAYVETFLAENTLSAATESREFEPFADIIKRIISEKE